MADKHLTDDEQARAVASWGRAGSFRCVGCSKEKSEVRPGLLVPTRFPGFALAACGTCAARFSQSRKFRARAFERAARAGAAVVIDRMADLAGVTSGALRIELAEAMRNTRPAPGALQRVDARMGLPLGTLEGALSSVLGGGKGFQ